MISKEVGLMDVNVGNISHRIGKFSSPKRRGTNSITMISYRYENESGEVY